VINIEELEENARKIVNLQHKEKENEQRKSSNGSK
jgi:hypothetical protein